MKAIEITRGSLRDLLNDDEHKSGQVTELQTRLTRYEEEARTLRAQVRTMESQVEVALVLTRSDAIRVQRLEALVTEIGIVTGLTLVKLAKAAHKCGLDPKFTVDRIVDDMKRVRGEG